MLLTESYLDYLEEASADEFADKIRKVSSVYDSEIKIAEDKLKDLKDPGAIKDQKEKIQRLKANKSAKLKSLEDSFKKRYNDPSGEKFKKKMSQSQSRAKAGQRAGPRPGGFRYSRTGAGGPQFKYKGPSLWFYLLSDPAFVVSAIYLLTILSMYTAHQARKMMKKAKERCSFKFGKAREVCLKKNRIKVLQMKLKNYKLALKRCTTTKDPKSCKVKVQEKIKSITAQIKKANKQLAELEAAA